MNRWILTAALAGCTPLAPTSKTTLPSTFATGDTGTPTGSTTPTPTGPTGDSAAPTGDTAIPLPACVDGRFPGPGTTAGAGDDLAASCGGAGGADVAALFTAPDTGRWRFALSGTAFDTVLSVLDGCGGAELACADHGAPEVVGVDLVAGQAVVVVVDGAGNGQGVYTLEASLAPDTETACTDGVDEDVDGTLDCLDPDCAGAPSCVEVCDDGLDNNLDGLFDCMDPSCGAAANCAAPCAVAALTGPLPISIYDSTVGGGDDSDPSCQSLSSAADRDYVFVAPATAEYTIDTVGSSFDTVMYLLDACGGGEIVCNDDAVDKQSQVRVKLAAGQRVIIVVDGYVNWEGDVRLNVY